MARVRTRIGWGKATPYMIPIAALNAVVAVALAAVDLAYGAIVVGCMAGLALMFALVHPHRVLELDEDDPADRQVGDLVE